MSDDNDEKLPIYSQDLIGELDKSIPHKCPALHMTEREIWMYAGKRELVDNLVFRSREADITQPVLPSLLTKS